MNEVKHEQCERSLKGWFPSRSEDRYNTGLRRTNYRDVTVRGAVNIEWLELRSGVHNGIRAGSRNDEPIGE